MTARVFISYRTGDGADKATALTRDLDALFGAQQVFLDKDDLAGGSRWRDVIAHTLSQRPVLLVLVTPLYLGALDAQGRRRIEQPDDPVRSELAVALQADAHVIPILCDGVADAPDVAGLPPPLNQLAERTWRRLRTYDWRTDVARLADDLVKLGIEPRAATAAPQAAPAAESQAPRRRRLLGVGGVLLLAAAGGGGWWAWQRHQSSNLSGAWNAMLGRRGAAVVAEGTRLQWRIDHSGDKVQLVSRPLNIENDRTWDEYRAFWKERFKQDLVRVIYRGEGSVRFDPGMPGSLQAAFKIESPTGIEIDGGAIQLTVGERGQRMRGTMWLNGEQADRVIEFRRGE